MTEQSSYEADQASSIIRTAQRVADEVIAEAKKEAERIRSNALELASNTEASNALAEAQKSEFEHLTKSVEKLREFEESYRNSIREYLTGLLDEVSIDKELVMDSDPAISESVVEGTPETEALFKPAPVAPVETQSFTEEPVEVPVEHFEPQPFDPQPFTPEVNSVEYHSFEEPPPFDTTEVAAVDENAPEFFEPTFEATAEAPSLTTEELNFTIDESSFATPTNDSEDNTLVLPEASGTLPYSVPDFTVPEFNPELFNTGSTFVDESNEEPAPTFSNKEVRNDFFADAPPAENKEPFFDPAPDQDEPEPVFESATAEEEPTVKIQSFDEILKKQIKSKEAPKNVEDSKEGEKKPKFNFFK